MLIKHVVYVKNVIVFYPQLYKYYILLRNLNKIINPWYSSKVFRKFYLICDIFYFYWYFAHVLYIKG